MAAHHGRDGAIFIGANQVGEVTAWSYNENGDELEVAAMGDTEKRFLTGLIDAGGQFTVYFDDADTEQEALDVSDDVEIHLYQRGAGVGKPELTSVGNQAAGLVRIVSVEYAGDTGSAVTRVYNFRNRLLKAVQA